MAIEVSVDVLIVELGQIYTTPFSVDLDPGTYTLRATYSEQTQEKSATVVEGQTTVVDFNFLLVTFTLTITATAGGVTNPSPGSYPYDEGTTATVLATPSIGYRFARWEIDGGVYSTPSVGIQMTKDYLAHAVFEPVPTHTLTISATTGGTTNPTPGPHDYVENTTVSVSATPSPGYRFVKWEVDGTEYSVPNFDVIMTKNYFANAIFELIPTYTLTIGSAAEGTTNPVPGSYTHAENATVKVTAAPVLFGWYFDHWILDGVKYTSNPIFVVMDSNRDLMAYFGTEVEPQPYKLTIIATLGGDTEPAPGVYETEDGEIITVTARAYSGYEFRHFELDSEVKMQNPINVGMDKDHTLLAVFKEAASPISITTIAIGATAVVTGTGIGIAAARKR